jgi:hypothetical protein
MFWVAQVRVQFRFQTAFNHRFGQFFEQATFPQDVLGRLVLFDQFINQFTSNGHLFLLKIKLLLVQVLTIYTNYFTLSFVRLFRQSWPGLRHTKSPTFSMRNKFILQRGGYQFYTQVLPLTKKKIYVLKVAIDDF